MPGINASLEVTGVAQYIAKLHAMQGRQLAAVTYESFKKSSRKHIVPRIASKRGWKYGGHGGKHPTKGLLGSRSKITAKKVKTRPGEYMAVSVKPRGWAGTVSAWVVRGTKEHDIRAAAPDRVVVGEAADGWGTWETSGRVRRHAIPYRGGYYSRVTHPGAEPDDYIGRAMAGVDKTVVDQLAADMFKAADQAAVKSTTRAAARAAARAAR